MTTRWAIYAPEDRSRLDEVVLLCAGLRDSRWLPGRINGDLLGLYWFCTPDSTTPETAADIARTWLRERGLL